MSKVIQDALGFDALQAAEGLTGKSYKADETTVAIGMRTLPRV